MSKRIGRRSIVALLVAVLVFTTVPIPANAAEAVDVAEVVDMAGEALEEASDENQTEAEEDSESETEQTEDQSDKDALSEDGESASEDSEEMTETEDNADSMVTEEGTEKEIEDAERENESVIEEETAADGIVLYAASQHTRAEAVAWAKAQSGKKLDYDGVYGAQCVDLIKYYYQYLGATVLGGNAITYADNKLPEGWSRISFNANVKDVQPGDIAVWTGTATGHVAIVVSADANGFDVAEQNYNEGPDGTYDYGDVPCAIRYHAGYRHYNGGSLLNCVIRPNFKGTNRTPRGALDEIRGGAGSVFVRGWAMDDDRPYQSLTIHVYIGGPAGSAGAQCYIISADKPRADIGYGNHGFEATIPTDITGLQNVYVYALDAEGINDNPQIGSGTVTIAPNRVKGSYMDTGYAQTIPDGYYHIVSSFDDKWWLTIRESSTDDGGNVEVADYSRKDLECVEHLFYFKFIDDGDGRGFYKITNKLSRKCLDVERASEYMRDENGNPTNVQQWEDNGSSAQRWAIREVDGGEKGMLYSFKARVSGFCLDLFGGEDSLNNGIRNISMYEDNESSAQLWRLVPYAPAVGQTIEDGDYQIVSSAAENKAIGADTSDNGANIELSSSYKGDYRQIFEVKYLGNGYYSIINKYSGLSLDVAGAYRALGTNVWLWNSIDYDAQKWIIKPCGNGYYNIISKCNGLYLDLEGGNTKDVNNISMWHWNIGGTNQMWKFASYVPKLTPPTASIPSGTEVEAGTTVCLLSGTDGAAIYYTLDGTKPSKQSLHYTKPFTIEKDTIITAYVVKDGYDDSDPAVFTYTVKSPNDYGQGDVLDEDVPQGRVENIPQGLWMSAVSSQIYTGKAIKPQVRVYDHTTLLTEKKDYTISYKNNIKANIVSGANVPTITVTGRGNYIGKEVQTFVIRQKSLSDVDIMADGITLQYNGKVQKPLPVVTWNGKKLSKNKDYTVSYPNEESGGMADPTAYIKTGTYKVLVKGMGNYTGEKAINLTITQSKPASAMTVAKIADHTYTGTEVRPVPVVKSGRVVLTEGEDYEVSYQDNIKVGTATVMITGKGSYAGVKKAAFKIVPRASLNKAKAEIEFDSPVIYTGSSVRPYRYLLTVAEKNSDGRTVTVTLTEGTDYEVSFRNDNKAGTAAIIFQGMNGYSGSLKKTYRIAPYDIGKDGSDLAEADQKIRIELADSYMYVKGGCKPEPVVTYQGKVLTKGTDYTLSYRNCNSLSDGNSQKKMPVVIVKGKGCFKGTLEKTYRITPKEIGRLTMTAADRMWQNKGNIFKTKVVIKDENGKALNAGKDYDRNFTYAYNSDTELSDGTARYAGDSVTAQDIIPAGTMIRITAAAKGSNYSGTVSCVYRITKADIGKAVVKIPVQTYTGRAITLENEIKIKLNGQLLPGENYKITGYSNNINKGTATVTISGINDCGGEKTVNFRIKEKGFLWWWR